MNGTAPNPITKNALQEADAKAQRPEGTPAPLSCPSSETGLQEAIYGESEAVGRDGSVHSAQECF